MIIANLCVNTENIYCVVEAMLSTLNFASLLYTHKLQIFENTLVCEFQTCSNRSAGMAGQTVTFKTDCSFCHTGDNEAGGLCLKGNFKYIWDMVVAR